MELHLVLLLYQLVLTTSNLDIASNLATLLMAIKYLEQEKVWKLNGQEHHIK